MTLHHDPACKAELCGGECLQGQYLSMPDPCPHVSRFMLIGARLDGDGLEEIMDHLETCPEAQR